MLFRSPAWVAERKDAELAIADRVVLLSKFQKETYLMAGLEPDRLNVMSPVEALTLEGRPRNLTDFQSSRMRVLFVGRLNLNKGLASILECLSHGPTRFDLTLVGAKTPETAALLKRVSAPVNILGVLGRDALKRQYLTHDLLVMPTVMESFGLVGVEAAACGLPVLCSDGVGVPFPDSVPRFNAMNLQALETSITELDGARERLVRLSAELRDFASIFSRSAFDRQALSALGCWRNGVAQKEGAASEDRT